MWVTDDNERERQEVLDTQVGADRTCGHSPVSLQPTRLTMWTPPMLPSRGACGTVGDHSTTRGPCTQRPCLGGVHLKQIELCDLSSLVLSLI